VLHHVDGQITWRDRQDLEHHLTQCWFCIDLIARFREIYRLARLIQPFSDSEADPYLRTIGIDPAPPSRWKRLFRAR